MQAFYYNFFFVFLSLSLAKRHHLHEFRMEKNIQMYRNKSNGVNTQIVHRIILANLLELLPLRAPLCIDEWA